MPPSNLNQVLQALGAILVGAAIALLLVFLILFFPLPASSDGPKCDDLGQCTSSIYLERVRSHP